MKKQLSTLVLLALSLGGTAHAGCYYVTAQDGGASIISVITGTREGAINKAYSGLDGHCAQQENSSLDGSTFRVERAWQATDQTMVSYASVWLARVYGCCH